MNYQNYLFNLTTKDDVAKEEKLRNQIMGLFYISNQQFFTVDDIMKKIRSTVDEVEKTLASLVEDDLLNRLSISSIISSSVNTADYLYELNLKGVIENWQQNLEAQEVFIKVLEHTIDLRDESNESLNQFIKKAIVFNSEVKDFITQRLTTYFKGID